MPKEIERKYLLSGLPSPIRVTPWLITQGYLSFHDPSIRIRRAESHDMAHYYITKKTGSGLVREETELALLQEQFDILWELVKGSLQKRRHLPADGWEIDEFIGPHSGLFLAEKEFDSVEEAGAVVIPDYLSDLIIREVTGEIEFTNSELARNGEYKNLSP